ncbi:TraX family protein [Murimonas intestini]|uniref:TraX protein n=1 Tax=Murimonas intestini TaxID=1337051 RepID=A0AB73T7L1_9FIRM|nr:TraX family protein [Murimonas intestini]MCR1841183.1 conjugal transfer protein TraX [Murimonas intestini]MCR1866101.1 conjugal transfer protein TraX [Murimonas intestini]MCR1882782.1 conjugal transfer protein TraX [Murimonas intestini]
MNFSNILKKPGLSGSTLKILAIIIMAIDHFGAVVISQGILGNPAIRADHALWQNWYTFYRITRNIGRSAFPIFCFLLVEGFLHTSNLKRYTLRLFLFALISEIPFNLAISGTLLSPHYQNVFFTLLIGLITIAAADRFRDKPPVQGLIFAAGMVLAYFLETDYDYKGVLLIVILYAFRYNRLQQVIWGAISVFWEIFAVFAFPFIWLYNGKRGIRLKSFFYWFYPLHLLAFWGIAQLLLKYIH